jgi:hypothetical protein
MTSRTFTASIITFAIASLVAPVEATARSGGFIAHPSSPVRGAVPPAVAPPIASGMTSPQVAPGRLSGPLRSVGASRAREFRQFGFRSGWGYASGVPDDYPPEYAAPYEQSPNSDPVNPGFNYRPGCRNQSFEVPSEDGSGQRTIHVTRCY